MSPKSNSLSTVQQIAIGYCGKDTWSINEGLMLLAGILPNTVNFKQETDELKISNAVLINHHQDFFEITDRYFLEEILVSKGKLKCSDHLIKRLKDKFLKLKESNPTINLSESFNTTALY